MNEVGKKSDENKPQWWYISSFVQDLVQVVDVLSYGDKKYPANDGCNWKRVPDAKRRYVSALFRHITAWLDGEIYDKETGKHHLAHAITNCLFLLWFERNGYPEQKK